MLEKLEAHNLYLKPEKCKFLKWEIKYLGVIVGNRVLKMNLKKLESVKNWATPNKSNRNTKIPRVHRILQILRPKLLTNHTTTTPSNKENCYFDLWVLG